MSQNHYDELWLSTKIKMLIYLVVLLVASGTEFAPNAYKDQAQGGVMSSKPLAFPDERPSNTTYDATILVVALLQVW